MAIFSNKSLFTVLLTGVAYYFSALFSVHFTTMPEGIAILWLPNAILLAAFLLSPKRLWWVLGLAGIGAEFAADIGKFPYWQITGFALVNLSEAVSAALLIGWLVRGPPMEVTLKNLSFITLVVLAVCPPLAALAGAQIYYIDNPSIDYWTFWRIWWFGDSTGIIVILPLILCWIERAPVKSTDMNISVFEVVGIASISLFIGVIILTPLHENLPWAVSPSLLVFCIVWAAIRTNLFITFSLGMFISIFVTFATVTGYGPFSYVQDAALNVLAVQEFLVSISILALFLGFTSTKLRQLNIFLEEQNADLEIVVAERTKELRSITNSVQKASRAKSDFLAHMSHELRAPLNSIIGFSEAILSGIHGKISNEKHLEYVGDIHTSGQHLLSLINDVLDLSKIEAGELELVESNIDLSEALDDCVRMIKGQNDAQTLSIQYERSDGILRLRGDERRVRQIVLNLLSNAVKYSVAGGEVNLSVRTGGDNSLSIIVSDTGMGIAEGEIAIVLEPFGQARKDSKDTHEGTGLGLSLSKQLAQLHGGSLTLESKVGEGTIVTVRFPTERTLTA
jgi:signal transduction histidine kinase